MPFFSNRVKMLEVQNHALIKTARETAERVDKLERELRYEREKQQAARESAEEIGRLERELQQARERTAHSPSRLPNTPCWARSWSANSLKHPSSTRSWSANSPKQQPNILYGARSWSVNSPELIRMVRPSAGSERSAKNSSRVLH
jgi:hypothetical protein